jgi:phosphoribosylamine--glycine ligase
MAPNAGTAEIATNVAIAVTDFEAIKALVIEKHRNGCCWARRPIGQRNLRFFLVTQLNHIPVIGPSKLGAQLEGVKNLQVLVKHISTTAYDSFTAVEEGCSFRNIAASICSKSRWISRWKGVLIIQDLAEAKKELRNMLVGTKFGAASSKV